MIVVNLLLGNSCWLNSVLQCLKFCSVLEKLPPGEEKNLLFYCAKLTEQMNTGKVFAPRNILSIFQSNGFEEGRMHCVHDCLTLLQNNLKLQIEVPTIQQLDQTLQELQLDAQNPIKQMRGSLMHHLECSNEKCGYKSSLMMEYFILELQTPTKPMTLQELIKHWKQPELIDWYEHLSPLFIF